jgi:hypothetical protein
LGPDKQCKFDYINRMITLSVITLSGFHCTYNYGYSTLKSDPLRAVFSNCTLTFLMSNSINVMSSHPCHRRMYSNQTKNTIKVTVKNKQKSSQQKYVFVQHVNNCKLGKNCWRVLNRTVIILEAYPISF